MTLHELIFSLKHIFFSHSASTRNPWNSWATRQGYNSNSNCKLDIKALCKVRNSIMLFKVLWSEQRNEWDWDKQDSAPDIVIAWSPVNLAPSAHPSATISWPRAVVNYCCCFCFFFVVALFKPFYFALLSLSLNKIATNHRPCDLFQLLSPRFD